LSIGYQGEFSAVPTINRPVILIAVTLALLGGIARAASGQGRLPLIRQRGALVCGLAPGVSGFARADGQGRYSGLDVDICRAVAAAIFGSPDKVRYEQASSVEQFQRCGCRPRVAPADVVASAGRHGPVVRPVMFYDGQGFLVPARRPAQKFVNCRTPASASSPAASLNRR
jgi:general L-amino acid transport system substrate-binding protein